MGELTGTEGALHVQFCSKVGCMSSLMSQKASYRS